MTVKIRPYKNGGWEVDIQGEYPNSVRFRKRIKAPVATKRAALDWGRDRERHLIREGPPQREQKRMRALTLAEFAPRFMEEYCTANRLKPSGIKAKESILRVCCPWRTAHGADRESGRSTAESHLGNRSAAVNNILTVLNKVLSTAFEWGELSSEPVRDAQVRSPRWLSTSQRTSRPGRGCRSRTCTKRLCSRGQAGLRLGEMQRYGGLTSTTGANYFISGKPVRGRRGRTRVVGTKDPDDDVYEITSYKFAIFEANESSATAPGHRFPRRWCEV